MIYIVVLLQYLYKSRYFHYFDLNLLLFITLFKWLIGKFCLVNVIFFYFSDTFRLSKSSTVRNIWRYGLWVSWFSNYAFVLVGAKGSRDLISLSLYLTSLFPYPFYHFNCCKRSTFRFLPILWQYHANQVIFADCYFGFRQSKTLCTA